MDVIGAGLPRTGTLSTRTALERLGFGPCYHMLELMENSAHGPLWQAAVDGGSVEWRRLFARYRATVDAPGCLYWQELTEAFPEAKVILTVRDPDRWYDSFARLSAGMQTVAAELPNETSSLRGLPFMGGMFKQGPLTLRHENGHALDRGEAVETYQRHIGQVRSELPAERLLVFDARQGWEPLCAFLGVDVPAEPFPHVNQGHTVFDNARHALSRRR